MSDLRDYLDKLAGGNLDDALELGLIAAEALATHLNVMSASKFEHPVEVDGKTYVVSVELVEKIH